MKKYLRLSSAFLLCLNGASMAAAPCPGANCTLVWSMEQATPTFYTHAKSYIRQNNDAKSFDKNTGKLTIQYDYTKGNDFESTAYAMFDFLSKYTPTTLKHGYLTATITVSKTDPASSIKTLGWPAFWLSSYDHWPQGGEIDIAEFMPPDNNTKVNLHGAPNSSMDPQTQKPGVVQYPGLALGDDGKTYTYGMEWDLNAMKLMFYFNNNLIGTYTLNPHQAPDSQIIDGFNNKYLKLIFNADNIKTNTHDATSAIKNLKTGDSLHYKLEAMNVKAYSIP